MMDYFYADAHESVIKNSDKLTCVLKKNGVILCEETVPIKIEEENQGKFFNFTFNDCTHYNETDRDAGNYTYEFKNDKGEVIAVR